MILSPDNVLVVGGGVAGLSAATAIADIGLDVVLVELLQVRHPSVGSSRMRHSFHDGDLVPDAFP